jgi:hypothetical protein
MGLVVAEPIKKVAKIPKILKMSVGDAKKNQNAKPRCKRKTEPVKGSQRKDKKKSQNQAEGKDMGRKALFWLGALYFLFLAQVCANARLDLLY